MERLKMCRICLVKDVRIQMIVDTHLEAIYESLSMMPLKTADLKPTQVCYLCYASLQNFYKLRQTCQYSERLLEQYLSSDMANPLICECKRLKLVHPVIETHIESEEPWISDSDVTVFEHIEVKVECIEDDEEKPPEEIIEPQYVKVKEEVEISKPTVEEALQARCSSNFQEASCDVTQAESKTVNVNKIKNKNNTKDKTTKKKEKNKPNKGNTSKISKVTSPASKKMKSKVAVSENVDSNGKEHNICDICQKLFRHRSDLLKHIRVHSDLRPYQCNVCGKGFNYRNVLRDHIRTHTGEKPYQCDVCQKCFRRLNHLKDHKLIHAGVKPYRCNICDKCFSGKRFLTLHVHRMHVPYTGIGEKPFECNVCEKRFKDKSYFNSHILTHTNEKPFQCNVCQKCFIKRPNLATHMRLHTGEKPYQCDECEKGFTSKCDLMRHFRVHSGEKPFRCDECYKCFSLKRNLGAHMIRVHSSKTDVTD